MILSESKSNETPVDYRTFCIERLKASGSRITEPRKLVIDCLDKHDRAVSAREIFESIEQTKYRIDYATVYRILERFKELKLIHQVLPSGNFIACKSYSGNKEIHVLVQCTICHASYEIDIPDAFNAPLLWSLKKNPDFEMIQGIFQIEAICRKCQGPNESEQPCH